jgi:hypothetical protein
MRSDVLPAEMRYGGFKTITIPSLPKDYTVDKFIFDVDKDVNDHKVSNLETKA